MEINWKVCSNYEEGNYIHEEANKLFSAKNTFRVQNNLCIYNDIM